MLFLFGVMFLFNSCHEAKGYGFEASVDMDKFIPVDTVLYNSLDNQIQANIDKYGCPGLAVAVIKGNRVIFEKQYGVRSIHKRDTINRNTIFRIGSVSKGFAGVLASILIEKGFFSLEDPVSNYISDLNLRAKSTDGVLRIKHVLSHTSGYTEHAYSNLVDKNISREILYKSLERLIPRDSTGKAYAYQNVAFSLIEKIIENTTGMNYAQALDYYIFAPLDMCSSSCTYEEITINSNHCVGHGYTKKGYRPVELGKHYYNIPSAGGVNAPLADMEKWLSAIMGNKPDVLSPQVLKTAFSQYAYTSQDRKFWNKKPDVLNTYYGLGWRLINMKNNDLVYHGGLVNGFRAEIAFDKKSKTGIVVLFNSLCNYSNSVVFDFFDFWNSYQDNSDYTYL